MAIKSKVIDLGEGQNETRYLYAECEVASATVLRLRWELESDRHREITRASGASNECQILEVDDVIPDNVTVEELQVDAATTGEMDSEGNPLYEYDVSLDAVARQAKYEAELRVERDALIAECDWLAGRHRDQTENSETTSLTGPEYTELLNYRKALRDWPADESDIYARTAPTKPAWM